MQHNTDPDFQQSAALIRTSFKRLFETLMEQTADRIYIKDTKSRFIFASDALARTHGLTHRSEIEGMTDFDFFDPTSAESFYAEEQEILCSGQPVINLIKTETWRDGTTTWCSHSKVPLRLESGTPIGILGISRDVTEEHQNKEQLRQANETMLADYASAEKVQKVMIPGRIPAVKGIELAYLWKPMAAVGGDIINFPRNPAETLLFFLGDVCGHGVQAAFYTVLLKYITAHAAECYDSSPQNFLNTVNQQITNQLSNGFITGLAGHFSEQNADGSRQLHLSHAGHPYLLVLRKDSGQIQTIELPSAMVMGLPGSNAAEPIQVQLHPGDRAYAFTDGIIEAADPEGHEFGMQQLAATIQASVLLPLQMSLDAIFSKATQHTGQAQQQDDITLLAFEVAQLS
jgi:phosphoserine phosphatase RsbU/P